MFLRLLENIRWTLKIKDQVTHIMQLNIINHNLYLYDSMDFRVNKTIIYDLGTNTYTLIINNNFKQKAHMFDLRRDKVKLNRQGFHPVAISVVYRLSIYHCSV